MTVKVGIVAYFFVSFEIQYGKIRILVMQKVKDYQNEKFTHVQKTKVRYTVQVSEI